MVGILDYGGGNVSSVFNALEYLQIAVEIISAPQQMKKVSHIILPGVGAFRSVMDKMAKTGFIDELREEVVVDKKPFLGICVGMQVLASIGTEFEESEGLGLISGTVERIDAETHGLRLPHIGWNHLSIERESTLFHGMDAEPIFYFVHSYHFVPKNSSATVASCEYGERVVAAVEADNLFGVQFHPEKSQYDGLKLLRNFARC